MAWDLGPGAPTAQLLCQRSQRGWQPVGTRVEATASVHHFTLPQSPEELRVPSGQRCLEKGEGKQGGVGEQRGGQLSLGPDWLHTPKPSEFS